jgi:integrase
MLDTGVRLVELLNLRWKAIRFESAGSAKYDFLKVSDGKSRNAARTLSLTSSVLYELRRRSGSWFVLPGNSPDRPVLVTGQDHLHRCTCVPIVDGKKQIRFPREFVLRGLRHTFLMRLGKAGADAFTIMKLAGHPSLTVSQRYEHPTSESSELAFERLEALNAQARTFMGSRRSLQKSLLSIAEASVSY